MTVAQAAERWGVSIQRVKQWIKGGRIKATPALDGIRGRWEIAPGTRKPTPRKPWSQKSPPP